jgi:hypothetical protein
MDRDVSKALAFRLLPSSPDLRQTTYFLVRVVPGEGLEPSRPEGPAGLSRLRLPVTPPGRAAATVNHSGPNRRRPSGGRRFGTHRVGPSADHLQQRRAHPPRRVARQPVGDDHALDHVDDDVGGGTGPHPYRDHRAAGQPPDRAGHLRPPGRRTEGRHHQPGGACRGADPAGELGEPNRRCGVHQPY